jgi:hypothetical protein
MKKWLDAKNSPGKARQVHGQILGNSANVEIHPQYSVEMDQPNIGYLSE